MGGPEVHGEPCPLAFPLRRELNLERVQFEANSTGARWPAIPALILLLLSKTFRERDRRNVGGKAWTMWELFIIPCRRIRTQSPESEKSLSFLAHLVAAQLVSSEANRGQRIVSIQMQSCGTNVQDDDRREEYKSEENEHGGALAYRPCVI